MNYNHLRYFTVLAEVEHYTLAAARLEISQPSLSSAIRNLENELGVKLFEKKGRNVQLTRQGQYFREKVTSAMEALSAAALTLATGADTEPIILRLGVVSGVLEGAVAWEIAAFLKQHRRVRFHVTEGSAADLMELLRQEKLDMAIVDMTVRDRSLHFRKLRQRRLVAAVPEDHPLADRSRVKEAELAAYPRIGLSQGMDRSFTERADRPHESGGFLCHANTARGTLSLVQAGVGITVIPEEAVQSLPGVTYLSVEDRCRTLYLCDLYDRWLDPAVWDFADQVVKALRSHPQEEQ
ncbi:MAG: LysR family transcriptional regulator [Oscillospiraceae bacterium]|nr:LysR family transcriptional regulator [Oscillospiraceae bacterium]